MTTLQSLGYFNLNIIVLHHDRWPPFIKDITVEPLISYPRRNEPRSERKKRRIVGGASKLNLKLVKNLNKHNKKKENLALLLHL